MLAKKSGSIFMIVALNLNLNFFINGASTMKHLDTSDGPQFLVEPHWKIDFPNTRGAIIACQATGSPTPRITWTKKDESRSGGGLAVSTLVINSTNLVYVRPYDNSLVFLPFDHHSYVAQIHNGIYRCIASNAVGSIVSREVHITGVLMEATEANVFEEYVTIGNTGVLKCHYSKLIQTYLSIVSWIQDDSLMIPEGSPIKTGQKLFAIGDNLYITNATPEDSSHTYKCRVRNRLTGEVHYSRTSGKLIITETRINMAPTINRLPKVIKGRKGSTLMLPCVASSFPLPSYRWYKRSSNSEETLIPLQTDTYQVYFKAFSVPNISPRSHHHKAAFSSSYLSHASQPIPGILVLSNVSKDDTGIYVCIAGNAQGEDRMTVNVIITDTLRVSMDTGRNAVALNEEVSLTCTIRGFPVHSIEWYKDADKINADINTNLKATSLNDGSVLLMQRATKNEAGCYQCIVGGEDQESTQGRVCLTISSDKPVLKEKFRSLTLQPSDRLSIKCVASGNPLPTITWTIDEHPLQENHWIQYGDYVSNNGNVVSFVNISKVRTEDGGLFRCKAINDAGHVEHEDIIHVRGSPVIRQMKNWTTMAGTTLKIRCPVKGYPIKKIVWKKEGRLLTMSEKLKVFENGTLVILDVQRELDQGWYSCEAFNDKEEKASSDFHLKVLKKPSISPFAFPLTLTEGMKVLITCNVLLGDPPITFHWLKGDQPLNIHSLNIGKTDVPDLASSLVFQNVSSLHAGNYTCIARNLVGNDQFTAPMVVKVPPRWSMEPVDQSAVIGEKVTFDCKAEGYPIPSTRWKYATDPSGDFKSISSNYHIQALENGSLTIKDVNLNDDGYYLCEAGNGVGFEISKVARLDVHVQAHFKTDFQALRVRKNDILSIRCEAFGEKPLDIKWIKDGKVIEPQNERNSRYSFTQKETSDGLLTELKAYSTSRDDSGSYQCLASNNYGKSEMVTKVSVEEPPDPPSHLKLVERGSKSMSLKFNTPFSGNSIITKYLVQWKLDKDSWSSKNVFSSEVNGNDYHVLITGLRPSTTYNVRIYAENAVGRSKPSETLTLITEEEVPESPPVFVQAEALSSRSIRVKWKPPNHYNGERAEQKMSEKSIVVDSSGGGGGSEHITGYYIGYKVSHSDRQYTFNTLKVERREKTASKHQSLDYVLQNLQRSTTYLITVQAYNSKGAGPLSPDIVCTTLDKDPPSAPRLKVVQTTTNSLTFKWNVNNMSDIISGYHIHLKHGNDEYRLYETISSNALDGTHTIRGLKCGSKYQMYMVSFNDVGSSEISDAIGFHTDGLAPVAPDRASALSINSTFVALHLTAWKTDGCPISNFVVQYKPLEQSEWILVSSQVSPLLENFILTSILPAMWYNLLVSAQSDAGNTEAQYVFATLTEEGGTVSPMSMSTTADAQKLRRYVQLLLPVTSVLVAVIVVVLFLIFIGLKRSQHPPTSGCSDDYVSTKGDTSPLSTGKVLYESTIAQPSCNDNMDIYCPSAYASTHLSSYLQASHQENEAKITSTSKCGNENAYQMPLLKSDMRIHYNGDFLEGPTILLKKSASRQKFISGVSYTSESSLH